MMEEPFHQPVLLEKAIEYLNCQPQGIYVDGTIGSGGHARLILEKTTPGGKLIGLDWDLRALARARKNLAPFGERVTLINKNFKELGQVLQSLSLKEVNGILVDLGISREQLENGERGFSFQRDGPLDMRMSEEIPVTAQDLVNKLSTAELATIFKRYGEERWAERIAKAIVNFRQKRPISTTGELVKIIKKEIPFPRRRIHPATRIFQALRIAVNEELENLDLFLQQAPQLLCPRGRLVIISFHSLEDRLVKNHFRFLTQKEKGKSSSFRLLTPKPVIPSPEEVLANPRARSAKLRALEKKF